MHLDSRAVYYRGHEIEYDDRPGMGWCWNRLKFGEALSVYCPSPPTPLPKNAMVGAVKNASYDAGVFGERGDNCFSYCHESSCKPVIEHPIALNGAGVLGVRGHSAAHFRPLTLSLSPNNSPGFFQAEVLVFRIVGGEGTRLPRCYFKRF